MSELMQHYEQQKLEVNRLSTKIIHCLRRLDHEILKEKSRENE